MDEDVGFSQTYTDEGVEQREIEERDEVYTPSSDKSSAKKNATRCKNRGLAKNTETNRSSQASHTSPKIRNKGKDSTSGTILHKGCKSRAPKIVTGKY